MCQIHNCYGVSLSCLLSPQVSAIYLLIYYALKPVCNVPLFSEEYCSPLAILPCT